MKEKESNNNNNISKLPEEIILGLENLKNLNAPVLSLNLSKEFIEAFCKKYDDTVSNFYDRRKGFKKEFKNYMKKEGIDLPKDFLDFIAWFEEVTPDANFETINKALLDNNTFERYNQYKIRTFKNPKWTIIKEVEYLQKLQNTKPSEKPTKINGTKPAITINSKAKETVFSILKDFFEDEQQDEFKDILTTFGKAKNKLIFKSNSNQFTDTFKKLFENNFILGCQKTDLINWIVLNFNFMYRNEVKEFKKKTVEPIISGKQTPCKKPIIEIKNGQILKIDY